MQKNYWGFKIERIDRYLFCNEKGEALGEKRVQTEINRIIKRIVAAGYEFPYITPHTFRHTFATRCFECDMPPKTVQHILGHSTVQMTMALYTHITEQKKQADMQKLEGLFRAVNY